MDINWKNHWTLNHYDPLANMNDPQLWSDFAWKYSIEFIENKFTECKTNSKNVNSINFLECGAGSGSISRYVKKKYNFNVFSLDNENESINLIENLAKKDNIKINTILSDISRIPFEDNYFDIIYLGGVMEYVDNIDLCLKELNRVLKKDGILVFLVVPNTFNIQFIGNFFMTIRYFFAYKKSKYKKLVPDNASTMRSKFYINKVYSAKFSNVTIDYLTPFPQLPLPNNLKRFYAFILRKSKRLIYYINKNNFSFKEYFTISFLISAKK